MQLFSPCAALWATSATVDEEVWKQRQNQPDPNEVPPTALTKLASIGSSVIGEMDPKEKKRGISQKCWAEIRFSSRRILEDWAFALHCSCWYLCVIHSIPPLQGTWPLDPNLSMTLRECVTRQTRWLKGVIARVWPVHFHFHRKAENTNFMTPNLALTFSERNLNQTLILNNIFQQSKSHATPQKTANSNHP